MHFSGYTRKYNYDVPEFMRDKPRKFVNHMRERMTAAAKIRATSVKVIDEKNGLFKVQGRGTDTWYKLNFAASGSDEMPHCQCPDWAQNLLPCKHFLAVMREHPAWNWSKFPRQYRQFPFITQDDFIVSKVRPPNENVEAFQEVDISSQMDFKELPTFKPNHRSKATACREVLKEMKSLTYIVYDEEVLIEVTSALEDIMAKLKVAATHDDGFVLQDEKDITLRSNKMSRSGQLPQNEQCQETLDIPLGRGKRPGSNRVGIGAENAKRASKFDIRCYLEQESTKDDFVGNVEEEAYHERMYDFYENLLWKTEGQDEASDLWTPLHADRTNTVLDKTSDTEIEITCVKKGDDGPPKAKRNLKLTSGEIKTIEENHMLTDESINISQNILCSMFPDFKGIQDTVVGATYAFDIVPEGQKFI